MQMIQIAQGTSLHPQFFNASGANGPINIDGVVISPGGVTGIGQIIVGTKSNGNTMMVSTGSYISYAGSN
jgi:hypothetical protein